MHIVTDGRTERQTDDIMMPRADSAALAHNGAVLSSPQYGEFVEVHATTTKSGDIRDMISPSGAVKTLRRDSISA